MAWYIAECLDFYDQSAGDCVPYSMSWIGCGAQSKEGTSWKSYTTKEEEMYLRMVLQHVMQRGPQPPSAHAGTMHSAMPGGASLMASSTAACACHCTDNWSSTALVMMYWVVRPVSCQAVRQRKQNKKAAFGDCICGTIHNAPQPQLHSGNASARHARGDAPVPR